MYTVLLCFSCALFAVSSAQESENGYIFTSPRSLNTGTSNELHLRRFGKLDAGVLKAQVYFTEYSSTNETLAAEKEFEIPAGERDSFLNLQVDKFENYVYNGRLQINGSFGDYKISGSDTVHFSTPKTKIIIIQTDKPIYKPGQQVKFRVLKLEKNLKPTGKDGDKADVYVEDPKGTRLFQFKDVDLGSGMVQNEFPLSEEPVQGNWKIIVSKDGDKHTTQFEVKKYVLPKFDVTIKFPSFVLADAEMIPIEVCAKYTYGKPVIGTLNLNSSLEKYMYSSEKYPTLQESIKLEGCYNYTLNVSHIETENGYRYRRIQITANVVEDGTGVDRNETQYLQRQYSPLNLVFNNDQSFYKPGLPFNGKLKVTNPDDSPGANEPIELCSTVSKERVLAEWWATKKLKTCKNYTTDSNGIIQYTIPPQNTDVVSIEIEAKSIKYSKVSGEKKNILSEPQSSMSLNAYYSPSGSFIQLQAVDEPVPCGKKQSFKLLFTSKEDDEFKFFYQIIKQADVVRADSVETSFSIKDDVSGKYENDDKILQGKDIQLLPPPQSTASNAEDDCPASKETKYLPPVGEVDIDIEVDASLSPTFYILVYYIRNDRETIADSQKVDVEKCFKNKVDFSFGDEAQQPGLKTSVHITAAPNSLCGIKTVDKSLTLLNNNDQLTKDNIFRLIDNMDNNQYYTSNPCNQKVPQPGLYSSPSKSIIRPPPRPVGSSSYEDSLSAFQSSGLIVISDMLLVTRPCFNNGGYGGYGGGYGSGSANFQPEAISFDSAPGVALSAPRRPVAIAVPLAAEAKVGISATKSATDVRTFFPETWLFEMEMTGPDGTYVAKERLPDTITQWIGSAVCINSEDGLGISNTTSITAFQAFFLDYTLPVSVIRGEEFVVVVSIFSYADGALPITVSLDNPEGFEITSESINGDVCVEPDTTKNLRIKLNATTVGKINITVRAETAQSSAICGTSTISESVAKDAITKPLDVEAEGFPQEKVFNSLFCPSDEKDSLFENTVSLTLPDDVVPDSSRAYMDFTGNVLGKAIENLDQLVALPTGCGEQNMVKFTPNYLVLDYLNDIGMINDKIERKAKRNLNTGYQRELTYRHDDGSFSAFGKVDREGSMFLTAFVLRSFYEAKRYISIDDKILKNMQEWIVSKQHEDGCFPDVGKILDIGLQGGIEKEKSSGSITAYVLASLLISKFDNETVINAAFSCLHANLPSSAYGSFLYAYAEALADKKDEAKTRIDEARANLIKTDGMEYFNIVNGSESIKIETDAYAVLTTLKIGGSALDALPYIRYLTAHLNPRGGFRSTQDTCVGLNALAQFAKLVYKDPLSLQISSSGGLEQPVELSDDNKLLVQRFKVTKVPTDVKVEAKGTGCGLLQTTLRYNTKTPPEKNKFFLDVSGKCSDTACKQATVNVIVSYLPPEHKAGMSVVEVKLITGTVAVKESLDKLTTNKSSQILRYDVENNKIVFYFSEMSNAGKVFSFQVEKVVEVENSQPGTAKVYDYYANENSATTSYTIEGLTPKSGSTESEGV